MQIWLTSQMTNWHRKILADRFIVEPQVHSQKEKWEEISSLLLNDCFCYLPSQKHSIKEKKSNSKKKSLVLCCNCQVLSYKVFNHSLKTPCFLKKSAILLFSVIWKFFSTQIVTPFHPSGIGRMNFNLLWRYLSPSILFNKKVFV